MNIVTGNNNTTLFVDIEHGKVFEHKGEYFMRTPSMRIPSKGGLVPDYNAVELMTGSFVSFEPSAKVVAYPDAEVVLGEAK